MRGIKPKREPSYALMIVIVLLAAPLAGCLGGQEETSLEPTGGAGATPQGPDGQTPDRGVPSEVAGTVATFDAEPVQTTTWFNGTFAPHEVAVGQQAPEVANADEREHEVTGLIPEGVPVVLEARITYEADEVAAMDVFVRAPQIYTFEEETAPGEERVRVVVGTVGDGPVAVVADADRPHAATETAYTLQVEVVTDPDALPRATPVAIDVPAQADVIELRPLGQAPMTSAAWGSQDTWIGRNETAPGQAVTYPVQGAGEHVILSNTTSLVRLLDPGGDPVPADGVLRPLAIAFETGEARQLPPQPGSYTFEIERETAPLAAGLWITSAEGGQLPGVVTDGATFEIRSPSGPVATTEVDCEVGCLALGWLASGQGSFFWFTGSPYAAENLTAGSYEIVASYDAAIDMEVAPVWAAYER